MDKVIAIGLGLGIMIIVGGVIWSIMIMHEKYIEKKTGKPVINPWACPPPARIKPNELNYSKKR